MFRSERLCIWCLCIVYLLILFDLATGFPETYGNPSSDFNVHSIVRPKLRHGRTKRDITTTRHSTGLHHTEVTVTVSIGGEDHELELRLNEDLVPSGHTLSYQLDGENKVLTPGKEALDICQYSGRVRGKPGSWAAVSTCHGVRGVIYDRETIWHIEPAEADDINGDHFLYSHEQLTKQHRCGHEGRTNFSYGQQQRGKELKQKWSRINRYKRHVSEDTLVREPNNVNSHTRYVELVLVVDNEEFRASGSDLHRVHHRMKDLANIINSVYAPLNIFIALVGVEVWSHHDKIVISEKSKDTSSQFAHYRETELVARIPNDNAHLLTRQNFLNGVVGRGFVGTMCSNKSSGVANSNSRVGFVALIIAHEMGHNFGMSHDHEDCECPSRKCIMTKKATASPLHWSSCNLRSLSLFFEKGMDNCLRNKPERLLGSSTCGNGFLEEGEQCDCGTAPGESSPKDSDRGACQQCCKPDCTLRANATCGHGQCCDLTTCHYKPIATECRSAQQECDLPEFCSGDSQFCPKDLNKMDTTPCGNQQGTVTAIHSPEAPTTPGQPYRDLSGLKIFMVVVYVIFLGIIPAVVLVLLLVYFFCPSAFSRWKVPNGSYIQKLSQRTNTKGFRFKFTLPNFNGFGKCPNKGKNDLKSSNLNVPSKLVVDETPASKNIDTLKPKSVVEVNIANVIRPSVNVTTTAATTLKKKNVKEPIRLNRKKNKEDIVIIHNTGGNNLNVNVKPKVDVSRKKLESPNNDIVNTPNINAVNRLQIEAVKKNFEASRGGEKQTSSFLIKSKPNVSSHPSKQT